MRYLFLLLSFSSFAFANPKASFDCTKATTKVEQAICQNDDFAHYDTLLSETYKDKKKDAQFLKMYKTWMQSRNSCNSSGNVSFCLNQKYVEVIASILRKFQGFSKPYIPSSECFRPFLPLMNGDQGFYAVRVISEFRGCGNLNINLEKSGGKAEVKFLTYKNNTYYYEFTETFDKEVYTYTLGVNFEKKEVKDRKSSSSTLVMSLVEAYEGGKQI